MRLRDWSWPDAGRDHALSGSVASVYRRGGQKPYETQFSHIWAQSPPDFLSIFPSLPQTVRPGDFDHIAPPAPSESPGRTNWRPLLLSRCGGPANPRTTTGCAPVFFCALDVACAYPETPGSIMAAPMIAEGAPSSATDCKRMAQPRPACAFSTERGRVSVTAAPDHMPMVSTLLTLWR